MSHSFIHFEAKKYAYRQTKDGIVVSFVLHPNDLPREVATAPIGTRVLLAIAEIRDEETTSDNASAADILPQGVASSDSTAKREADLPNKHNAESAAVPDLGPMPSRSAEDLT